jgi:putative tryptophan/tyrosine transport system substrate-binding protein
MPYMKRREFITVLAATAAWPLAARAQQAGQRPTIGFLGTSSSVACTHWTPAFVRRLGELGWIDGRNVTIEYRWAEGRAERYVEVAAEFVRLKVDTLSGTAIATAKQETSTIPIVFAVAVDPERN